MNLRETIDSVFPYDNYNPHQQEAIEFAVKAFMEGKKFAILEAPTGSGKSGIGYTIGETMREVEPIDTYGPYSIILTKTIFLQKQYARDFHDVRTLWSAVRYTCPLLPTDPEAYYGGYQCKRNECSMYEECPYVIDKAKLLNSSLGVLNYAYFGLAREFRPRILICDECHNLENIICDQATITLSKVIIERLRELVVNHGITEPESLHWTDLLYAVDELVKLNFDPGWMDTAKHLCSKMGAIFVKIAGYYQRLLEQLRLALPDSEMTGRAELRMLKAVNRIAGYARTMSESLDVFVTSETPWIIQERDLEASTITYKPIYAAEFGKKFFSRAKHVVLMSATICGAEQLAHDLGIDKDDYAAMEMPSNFPIEGRPVLSIPMEGLNNRNIEGLLPKYVEMVDKLIEEQLDDWRGIIHSVSYKNAEFVLEHSRYKDRMVLPKSEDIQDIISILESRPNTIVVSPSITEGVDLRGNLSRFNIILKVPFLYLGDPWIAEKMRRDNIWYVRNAVVHIVQGSGRSTRDDQDWSVTFILDGNFRRIYREHAALFPSWWKEAVAYIDM